MNSPSAIQCPECTSVISDDYSSCSKCSYEIPREQGVLTFGPKAEPPRTSQSFVDQIAGRTTSESIRSVMGDIFNDCSDAEDLRERIFNTRNDAWRVLVSEHLDGRCLDLYAGFGRRSLTLAEVVDSVYAVDPNLTKLQVLAHRDDFDSSSKVIPVHADGMSLCFQNGAFDTIVADFTGYTVGSINQRIDSLNSLVDDDGSLIVFVSGAPGQLGLTDLLGLGDQSGINNQRPTPLATARYRRYMDTLGYKQTSTYTLCPTSQQLRLFYELGNKEGSAKFLNQLFGSSGNKSLIGRCARVANQLGVLDYLYPTYLLVGSKSKKTPNQAFSKPVLSTGRSRSVVLNHNDEQLASVWKYPNCRRHSAYNEREHHILQWLQSEEPHVQNVLPEGELIQTKFGTVRKEQVVFGTKLSTLAKSSLASMETALSLGLEWLVEFQQPATREWLRLTPEQFVDRFSLEAASLEPPTPDQAFEIFLTSIHGDFQPGNVYMTQNRINSVIDWEYGDKAGNPVIDSGLFVANVLKHHIDSERQPMVELVKGTSEPAEICRKHIQSYCDAIGVDFQTFSALLPTCYVKRLAIDYSIGSSSTYTRKSDNLIKIIESVWTQIGL